MNMMMNDDTRDELRIRAALSACDKVDADWIATRVELALALKQGRDRHRGDDRRFGAWLDARGLDHKLVNHQDRAALLNIADHVGLFREVMAEATSRCPQLIWRDHMKPVIDKRAAIFTNASKDTTEPESPLDPTESAQSGQSANESAEPEQSPPPVCVAAADLLALEYPQPQFRDVMCNTPARSLAECLETFQPPTPLRGTQGLSQGPAGAETWARNPRGPGRLTR
ncbi:MAG: hypothetical protein JOY71_23175 [Acetobacteraceae bacterium]|nr:hypothetical protein [Acetobacteraceae bacterium]